MVIVDTGSEFCDNVETLRHLIQSDSRIKLDDGAATFEGNRFAYDLQFGVSDSQSERYFHVTITCPKISDLDCFERLMKLIRTQLFRVSNKEPQLLWDDIGYLYALKAYPLINDVENLLRKLITKFMLTKVGRAWVKEAVPREVSESVKAKTTGSYLHNVDFIQLSTFLFKAYVSPDSNVLVDQISKAKRLEDLSLDVLKGLVPRTNWDKYFTRVIN